jgi:hypothetical protein
MHASRGWRPLDRARLIATVHPSSLLRITKESERHREYQRFVADLKRIAAHRAARVSKRFS